MSLSRRRGLRADRCVDPGFPQTVAEPRSQYSHRGEGEGAGQIDGKQRPVDVDERARVPAAEELQGYGIGGRRQPGSPPSQDTDNENGENQEQIERLILEGRRRPCARSENKGYDRHAQDISQHRPPMQPVIHCARGFGLVEAESVIACATNLTPTRKSPVSAACGLRGTGTPEQSGKPLRDDT